MKKILLSLVITLLASVSLSYGIPYPTASSVSTAATTSGANAALAKVASINTSNVDPKYAKSVEQLKQAVTTIINSVKVLAPALVNFGKTTVSGFSSGDLMGGAVSFVKGGIELVSDSDVRNAAVNLVKTVIATIDTAKVLANADPSTKKTVKDLLGAVAADPDVSKVISLAGKVPIVGNDLKKALTDLITLNF